MHNDHTKVNIAEATATNLSPNTVLVAHTKILQTQRKVQHGFQKETIVERLEAECFCLSSSTRVICPFALYNMLNSGNVVLGNVDGSQRRGGDDSSQRRRRQDRF